MEANTDNLKKRRKQIFEAAVKVISSRGFHKATIGEIAIEAQLGKGTIYEYIRKKEDLITLIAEEGIAMLAEELEEVTSSSDTPNQKLRRMIDITLHHVDEHSMLARTMAVEVDHIKNEHSVRLEGVFVERILNVVKAPIEDVMPGSRFSPDDSIILANILIALCFLWAHSDLVRKYAGGIETYRKILSNLFLEGVTQKEKENANG